MEEGIASCVSKKHFSKAPLPIDVTEGGITICDNEEHS